MTEFVGAVPITVVAGGGGGSIHEAAVLALSPSSFWRLSEPSGALVDQVGSTTMLEDLTAGCVPARAVATGKAGVPAGWSTGPRHAGDNYCSSLWLDNPPAQPVTNKMSLAGWYQQIGSIGGWIMGSMSPAGHVDPYYVFAYQAFGSGANTMLSVGTDLPFAFDNSGPAVVGVDSIWHHFALVYDGVNKKFYIDGTPAISLPWTGNLLDIEEFALANSAYTIVSGAQNQHDRPTPSLWAEWGWWNDYALTSDDIAGLIAAGGGGTYIDNVIADGAVGYYKMDESSMTTLVDSSGNGRNWAVSESGGSRTFGLTTPSGKAIRHDTAGGGWSRFSSFRDTDKFSVEFVTKFPDNTSNGLGWWHDTDGASAGDGYSLVTHNGKVATIWNGGGYHDLCDSDLFDGNYHHIVVTYNGTIVRCYVDGALQTTSYTPAGAPVPSGGSNTHIAKAQGQSFGAAGAGLAFGDLAYYHKVLSATRIAAHAAAGGY